MSPRFFQDASEKAVDQAEVKLTIVAEQPFFDRAARVEDELKEARRRALCVHDYRILPPDFVAWGFQDAPDEQVDQAEVKLGEPPLVDRVARLEDELQALRAEHGRCFDELRQLVCCHRGPVADREDTAEPEAADKVELARSMFDAVLLVGSRSPDAPLGWAVSLWALLLFVLNTIIQVLIVYVVVYTIATDQLVSADMLDDFWCASARASAGGPISDRLSRRAFTR